MHAEAMKFKNCSQKIGTWADKLIPRLLLEILGVYI